MDSLNRWLGLLANLGVLVGIAFLAVEIQQNTNATKAQTRDALAQKQIELFLDIASDESSLALLRKGTASRSQEELEPDEALGFLFLVQSNLRMWENEHYQYKAGLFDDDEFGPRLDRWRVVARSPGRRWVWASVREGYSSEFRELMDDIHTDRRSR